MERTLNFIGRKASRRNLILCVLGSIITIAVMSIATQMLVYEVYGDFTMPDMRFGYTFDEIQTAFNTIGIEGLWTWVVAHSPDFLFPLAYSFAMMFGITMELNKVEKNSGLLRTTVFLPLVGGIADYIENTLILGQIAVFPNLSELVISIASAVTLVKWAFLILSFRVIFVLLFLVVYKKISSRTTKE
ncbi:MAG: hypothetical protein E4H14_08270 [Candidatus Thorarchaeota archaeon]|nr:MAG: hypothetical protein E4H14_08270 [Candidatus Thorarchaeota archaeon]